MDKKSHILVIEARFYEDISEYLLQGALASLSSAGITSEVITVPGILELPIAAKLAFGSHAKDAKRAYDGYIVLGCAIKGQTDHYEHVCEQSMRGVQHIALDFLVPMGNAILTCPSRELALLRADPDQGNAGGRAVEAFLCLISLKRKFEL